MYVLQTIGEVIIGNYTNTHVYYNWQIKTILFLLKIFSNIRLLLRLKICFLAKDKIGAKYFQISSPPPLRPRPNAGLNTKKC